MAAPAAAKPPTGNRKTFRRTKVSPVERVVSLITVVLIVVIGVAIWFKGKHYNPDRFALNPDALKSTAAAVEGKSGTARGADVSPGGKKGPRKTQKRRARETPPPTPRGGPPPPPPRPQRGGRWKSNSTG